MFQISVSDTQLDERLDKTEPFSRRFIKGVLSNCVNLTLVLLGVVTSDKYLSVCTNRKQTTKDKELILFIAEALKKCGRGNATTVSIENSKQYPVSELKRIGEGLLPEYATCLKLIHPSRDYYHMVLLRKDRCGRLFCIDPQVGEDGLYPEQANGISRILKYIQHDGYTHISFITSSNTGLIHSHEIDTCRSDHIPISDDGVFELSKPVSSSSSVSPAETVKPVSSSSISPSETTKPASSSSAEPTQAPPLIRAIWMRDRKLVKMLLDIGSDPNEEDSHGNSALDYAKTQKSPEIYDMLIKSMRKGGRKTRRRKLTRRTRKRT